MPTGRTRGLARHGTERKMFATGALAGPEGSAAGGSIARGANPW
jgi:hypothetical protein